MSYAYSLASADVWVDDVRASLARMEPGFGLNSVPPISAFPDFGVEWVFAPVGPTSLGATKFEVIGPDASTTPNRERSDYPFTMEFGAEQARRPARFHATVVKTLDLDGLLDRLRSLDAVFRLDPPTTQIPRPRLFLGNDPRGGYQPQFDGGVRLEFWEPYAHELAAAQAAPAAADTDFPVRIESRVMLVEDVDQAIASMRRFIGWEPARAWRSAEGFAAEFTFDDPVSARLQIVSPAEAGDALGRELAAAGPGAWTIRFVDRDLASRREALAAAGMPAVEQPSTDGSGRRSLWVDLRQSAEGLYEFVEPA